MTEKILLFNRWDLDGITVADPGLVRYVNLKPIIVPRTGGKFGTKPFHKTDMNIVERLMNKIMIPGHKGKRHKLTSGRCVGRTSALYRDVKKAFELIEKRANKNPVQVLVEAIVNAATYEEVTGYRLGGTIARKAVITSPQRRVDTALRYIAQGVYRASFGNKRRMYEVLADELIGISRNDNKTFAVRERQRLEKEAEGAR